MKTAAEIISTLGIVEENYLAEAANQQLLFVEAARYRVLKMRKRSNAQAEFDYASSRLAIMYRDKKDTKGKRELTEGAVKEKITVNSKIRNFRLALEKAHAEEEFSKLLLDAFKMRRDAIRIIADAQNYEGGRETKEAERILQSQAIRKKARELEANRVRKGIE